MVETNRFGLRSIPRKKLMPCNLNLAKNTAKDLIGPGGEPTANVFLNRHSVKL